MSVKKLYVNYTVVPVKVKPSLSLIALKIFFSFVFGFQKFYYGMCLEVHLFVFILFEIHRFIASYMCFISFISFGKFLVIVSLVLILTNSFISF